MLKQLYVKDFTLIDELNIDFHPGFSVITGETGAGKSIILGALHLLLGQRADSKQIKSGCKKCVVEAHFDLSHYDMEDFFTRNNIDYDATDCIVRREVSASGKSRAFINDTPVSLNVMRDLGEQLVDIHSQHQNLLLQKEDFQLNVVDIIAKDAQLLNHCKTSFGRYQEAKTAYANFQRQCEKARENEDFLRFQHAELDKAALQVGEQEDLEQRSTLLTHAEGIKSSLYHAAAALSGDEAGCLGSLSEAIDTLRGIEAVYPDVKGLADRLDTAYIELKDISQDVDGRKDSIDYDPAELEQINERLDMLNSLLHKYHAANIEELISTRDKLAEELGNIDGGDEQLDILKKQVDKTLADYMALANQLSSIRRKAAESVQEEMKKRLQPLGIPNVRFSIDFQQREPSPTGTDKVAFLFSANTSSPLQPVSQVASGGEIARVMLSLKAMISGAVKLPTIIFDEIDTGVSGRVAEKMAQIMEEMGENHRQVISITHLPQIAAMGSTHYKVSKEETDHGTTSRMTMLSEADRVREIAQMLSGSSITEAAIENAKALLGKK